jgi:hypothetical protein
MVLAADQCPASTTLQRKARRISSCNVLRTDRQQRDGSAIGSVLSRDIVGILPFARVRGSISNYFDCEFLLGYLTRSEM